MRDMENCEKRIGCESEMREFGLELAEKIKMGDVIALMGDLGTGKTTLTKYIAEGLGVKETISSPTFTIVKEYKSGRIPLYHFDVYRLAGEEEFLDIGAEEFLYGNGVCVIEWADIVAAVLPENATCVKLSYGKNSEERIICIS